MSPELQQVAAISNVLAAIDGSVHRSCLQCGAIFKVTLGAGLKLGSHCPECDARRECCDEPDLVTTSSRTDTDGNFSTTKQCRNCGWRVELSNG